MRKIAVVFDGLGFGGIERVGLDYVRMLHDMGNDVNVYNLHPSQDALTEAMPDGIGYFKVPFDRKICPELYSYGVQRWWWGKYAYAVISPTISLVQTIYKLSARKRKYDISIAMSGHINDISFITKGFVRGRKKICWCHGSMLSYFAICDAYPILYRKIDCFVTLSSAGEKDIYPGHRFMHEKKIYKIYNPTYISEENADLEQINQLKEKYGKFVLMIARADERKGHDITIRVARRLKERGCGIKFVFLGDGVLLDSYRKMAAELDVAEECIFEGYKRNVKEYIMASHINLLTSEGEGLPTVIIEAMALGKPCVMSNCDGGEVSGDGEYCMLADIADVEGTASCLIELLDSEERYRYFAEQSLKRSQAFKPDVIREQLSKMIGDICGSEGGIPS